MNNLDKVVYQIYPKSFLDTTGNGIGDLKGIIDKVDYLADLGIDYVWLSPICLSPQKDNGYDIADYYTIDPMFGTNQQYQQLIELCADKEIKVVMDLVLNHVSDQHVWFQKAISGDKYYQDFFIWRDAPNELISAFKVPAWTYNEAVGKYYLHLFDASQPDLNWDNENVRQELYQMINYWIDKGVGGFRLDVIDLIGKQPDLLVKAKGENFLKYLKELANSTFKNKIFTVGECWKSSVKELEEMCNENGLTQAFHFNYQLITKKSNKWDQGQLDVAKLAEQLNIFQNQYTGEEAIVMNNHDLPRLNSFWLDDTVYHAQSSKLLISLFGILSGTLYLYQGDEIGMTNAHFDKLSQYRDVETFNYYDLDPTNPDNLAVISRISRDNARVPMQWDDSKYSGFTTGTPWIDNAFNYQTVNVKAQVDDEASILNYYKKIIDFRKQNQNLINTKLRATC
ncbi:alpha-glucosidase [Mollicutes bacterium LVI A0039]|nr:alpha-glucosidase [Mollicutes bacterium LVI A0039]